jgi:hypothetical protein
LELNIKIEIVGDFFDDTNWNCRMPTEIHLKIQYENVPELTKDKPVDYTHKPKIPHFK